MIPRWRAAHPLAARRLPTQLPGGVGHRQPRVARGIHPDVPGTRPAPVGRERAGRHDAPLLADGGSLLVAPVREAYPAGKAITVTPLPTLLNELSRMKG